MTVGALVKQLPITNGHYTGGEFGWFSPFAVLCGIGLYLGYALLGACWLVRKCEGDVREAAYRLIRPLAVGLLAFLVVVFGNALAENLRVCAPMAQAAVSVRLPGDQCHRGSGGGGERSASPGRGALLHSRNHFRGGVRDTRDPFWPYMIPFSITIEDAAAPHPGLAFMFWGAGIVVFPLMLLYTAISYTVFRGKRRSPEAHS